MSAEKVKTRKLTQQTLAKSIIGSTDGNKLVDAICNFDVSHPLLEAFQALAARQFVFAAEYTNESGNRERIWSEFDYDRSAPEVEDLYSRFSDVGVSAMLALLLLQSTQREAIQASALLSHFDILEQALQDGVEFEYISLKEHKEKKSEKAYRIGKEDIQLVKGVAAACLARYEHTVSALVTRAKSKKTRAPRTGKIGGKRVE